MKAKDQAAEQQQELAKTLESRATSADTTSPAPSISQASGAIALAMRSNAFSRVAWFR